MSNIYESVQVLENDIRELIKTLPEVTAEQLGLDPRAGYRLWINDDNEIIVEKHNDRTLQYYGGFEYVEPEARTEIGKYVIYFNISPRVAECFDYYFDEEDEQASDC
jgi:hypothetical protein